MILRRQGGMNCLARRRVISQCRVLAFAAMNKWSLFFAALGLAMFLEGLPYLISPSAVRRYLETIQRTGDVALRAMGFALIALGLLVTYVATR